MLTKEEKLNILNTILSSKGFRLSKSYSKLLKYLVEASISETKLKEYSLAIDVFDKSKDFNSSEDSSVRVYVSNLRKKLDHYYATEGRNDEYKIEIPKGHYDLVFVKNQILNAKSNLPDSKKNLTKAFIFLSAIFGLLTFFFGYMYLTQKNAENKNKFLKTSIWKNLITDKKPVLIVLGNDLFFLEKQNGEETIVRKHYINTTDEFKYYKKTHPEEKIDEITPYYFYSAINVTELPILLYKLNFGKPFKLKSSFNFSGNDTKLNDVIFFGSFRNLFSWKFLLTNSSIKYGNNPDNLYLEISVNGKKKIFKQSGEPNKEHVDYCLFRKLPGPNKNTIYMFISFFQPGLAAATNYLLNEKTLNKLTQKLKTKYGKLPEYFDVLFKTRGYSGTPFKTSIEYINKIDPQKVKLW